MTEPTRVPDACFRADEAEYPAEPGVCRCACAVCGALLPCEGMAPLDDFGMCVCHGAPWDVRGGPCSEVS